MRKTVFLSDVSGMLGRVLAEGFLARGDRVLGIGQAGPSIAGVECFTETDPTIESQVISLAQTLAERGEAIDALVLCAREMAPIGVLDDNEPLFDRILAANTKSAFQLARHIGALMSARGQGATIFIGSIHAEKPNVASFAFSCSMGALKMLSAECSMQLGRYGVHSVFIELGPVAGDEAVLQSDVTPQYEDLAYRIPRKRLCTFEELCPIVAMAMETPMLNGADIRADAAFTRKYLDRKEDADAL